MGLEMLVILALAMLLFGPKKLPEISRTIAKFMSEFRKAGYEFKSQIEDEVRKLELQAEADRRTQEASSTKVEPSSAPGTQPRQIMPPSVGETVGMRPNSFDRDESFDSVPGAGSGSDGSKEAASPTEQPNAETVKGPNA